MRFLSFFLPAVFALPLPALSQVPGEPVVIERGVPQFFVDDWLVDNRFAIRYKNQSVLHRVHPPVKHESNPVYEGDSGYVSVARHPDTEKFQLWTQVHRQSGGSGGGGGSQYAIAYAESDDGLAWHAPTLGLFEWGGSRDNNIVIRGPKNARASGPQVLLTLPEKDRRGYHYIMTYRTGGAGRDEDGIRLIGSQDGIHWDPESGMRLKHIHSDTLNSIGMTFGGPHWIEVGDEWWFYYAGHDEGHQSKDRKAAIGLATCPKERLVGLHGPANGGGVVVTRLLKWPGGDLFLNAATGNAEGRVSVRVSDAIRDVTEGFDHSDCEAFSGDSVRHRVTWKGGRSMAELEGRVVRLEIFLQDADLFTITAGSP